MITNITPREQELRAANADLVTRVKELESEVQLWKDSAVSWRKEVKARAEELAALKAQEPAGSIEGDMEWFDAKGFCVMPGTELYLAAGAQQKPDMFWNHDDAEKLYRGIGEFLNDEICNGSLEVGDIREVQQAKQLPNIKIRITSIDENECDADWEEIK